MSQWIKRVFDIVFSLLLGIVLLPVFACICVVMKVSSPGPLLFRQKRLGKSGQTFMMNKFRKFPADWGAKGPGVTLHQDSRMTGVGSFLERTKLDELPQLWNIFIGEMSFVGPRPESLRFRHLFVDEFAHILDYKPGIFGPNQTKYRNESLMYPVNEDPEAFYEATLFPAKAKADLAFFGSSGFLAEVGCIVGGVFTIIFSAIVWRKSMKASLILFAWDVCSLLVAWVITHWLKYSFVTHSAITIKPAVIELFYIGLFLSPVVLAFVFAFTRVYRHPARYFSETDCYRLIGACCAVWILTASIFGVISTSTSSLIVGVVCILSTAFMIVPRVLYSRFYSVLPWAESRRNTSGRINVVVCGINQQSIELSRLLRLGFAKAKLIGFVVDDKGQVGREISGAEVVGQYRDLDILLERYKLQQVWVSDAVNVKSKRQLDEWCQSNGVQVMVLADLPGFQVLSEHEVSDKKLQSTSVAVQKPSRQAARAKKASPEVAA